MHSSNANDVEDDFTACSLCTHRDFNLFIHGCNDHQWVPQIHASSNGLPTWMARKCNLQRAHRDAWITERSVDDSPCLNKMAGAWTLISFMAKYGGWYYPQRIYYEELSGHAMLWSADPYLQRSQSTRKWKYKKLESYITTRREAT